MGRSTARTMVFVGLLLMCIIIVEPSPIFHEPSLGADNPEELRQSPSGNELQNGVSENSCTASEVKENSNVRKLNGSAIPTDEVHVQHAVDNHSMSSDEQLSVKYSSMVESDEKPSGIILAGMHPSEVEIIQNVIVGTPNANGSVRVQSYNKDFSNLKLVNGLKPLQKDENIAATAQEEYFETQSSENSPVTISFVDSNASERKLSTSDDERIVFNAPECKNHTTLGHMHTCEEQRIVKKSQALDQVKNIDESELAIESIAEDKTSATHIETYSPNKVVIPIPRSGDSIVGAGDIDLHDTIVESMKPDASTIIIITSPSEEISVKHFVLPKHDIKDEYYVTRENNSIFLEKLKQGIEPAYDGLEEQLVPTSYYTYQRRLGNFTEDIIRTNNTVISPPEVKQRLHSTSDGHEKLTSTKTTDYNKGNNFDPFVSVSENPGGEIVSPTVSQNDDTSSPAESESNTSEIQSSNNPVIDITTLPVESESNTAGDIISSNNPLTDVTSSQTESEGNIGDTISPINPLNHITSSRAESESNTGEVISTDQERTG